MRLLPHVLDATGRLLLLWDHGARLPHDRSDVGLAQCDGSAAARLPLEQHLGNALQDYTRELDRANRYALSAQSLLPDIQLASRRFASLADSEENRRT